jgi:hypothetical protein
MAFKINHPSTRINGTHLQGYLDITYQELVMTLGKPQTNYDNSLAHWTILGGIHGQSVVATIYDYKNNRDVNRITDWHIGGYDQKALTLVRRAIGIVEFNNVKNLK